MQQMAKYFFKLIRPNRITCGPVLNQDRKPINDAGSSLIDSSHGYEPKNSSSYLSEKEKTPTLIEFEAI